MTKPNPITIGGFNMFQIGMIVAAIYAVLCIITGGAVYGIYYGWKVNETTTAPPGDGIATYPTIDPTQTTTSIPPTTNMPITTPQPTINGSRPPTIQPIDPSTTTTSASKPTCNILENGVQQCQTKSPCNPLTDINCQFCQSPCTCLCREPIPIEQFTGSQVRRDSKTISEWLNLYPPLSANRLIVVTTLLDDMIEPWALIGYFQSCKDNSDATFKTNCRICEDRYKYVKCVMSSNLIDETWLRKWAKPKGWFNLNVAFTRMRLSLPYLIYYWRSPETKHPTMSTFKDEIDAMTVTTTSGIRCKVCEDFNVNVYDKCYSKTGRDRSNPPMNQIRNGSSDHHQADDPISF